MNSHDPVLVRTTFEHQRASVFVLWSSSPKKHDPSGGLCRELIDLLTQAEHIKFYRRKADEFLCAFEVLLISKIGDK